MALHDPLLDFAIMRMIEHFEFAHISVQLLGAQLHAFEDDEYDDVALDLLPRRLVEVIRKRAATADLDDELFVELLSVLDQFGDLADRRNAVVHSIPHAQGRLRTRDFMAMFHLLAEEAGSEVTVEVVLPEGVVALQEELGSLRARARELQTRLLTHDDPAQREALSEMDKILRPLLKQFMEGIVGAQLGPSGDDGVQ